MADTLRKLRIFVASPSDVANERAKVEMVVASLKPMADYLGLTLEVVDWRAVVPQAGRPQQVIFDQLKPTSWDVFVGILWHRFGTPTGAKDPQTKKNLLSGTEEEFRLAYGLWKQFKRPRLMMYRCTRQVDLNAIDFDQAKQVKQFFDQFDAVKGSHPGLYHSFDSTDAFERLLLDHLQRLVIAYGAQEKIESSSSQHVPKSLTEKRLRTWHPPTNVIENDDSVQVLVEIAGLNPNDMLISLIDNFLQIRGNRVDNMGKGTRHLLEIPFGEFSIEIKLTGRFNDNEIAAVYSDGMLIVTLPKIDKNSQDISVQVQEE